MKLETLNRWLTLSANIGVLIGIVFLAIEIQQNTNVNRAIAINAIQTGAREQIMALVEYPELLAIEMKSRQGEDLSSEESLMLAAFYNATLLNAENAFFQKEAGLISEDFLRSLGSTIQATTQNHEVGRRYWERNKSSYTVEFQAYVDSLRSVGHN